jgi:hypothetical protein
MNRVAKQRLPIVNATGNEVAVFLEQTSGGIQASPNYLLK